MSSYNPKAIEKKWQAFWDAHKFHSAKDPDGSSFAHPKKYVLDMFPYPSGEGLHVGHPLGYIASDVLSRYFRMRGYNVLHPMGWDAFGLPAENYAIKHNIHPRIAVERNIKRFKEQLGRFGFSYDWEREINTTDPEYYRWTQWIFLQLFKKGLAYEKEAPINFCPSCKTGLANEEVTDGACERCGTKVERRRIRQWMLKITAYAERLLADVEQLEWPEKIKTMQRNWIGKSEGVEIIFQIISRGTPRRGSGQATRNTQGTELRGTIDNLSVFTTRPDTLFGATYVVLAPEHEFLTNRIAQIANRREVEEYIEKAKQKSELERLAEIEEKTGVKIEGIVAVNPVNGERIPVFVADYVLAHYGTGAIMAVPAHDERDFAFAKAFQLPIIEVISPDGKSHGKLRKAYVAEGILVNSGEFNGLWNADAKERIVSWLEKQKLAERRTYWKLRDWIFSRQRYWGEPIPLVFCRSCKTRMENYKLQNPNSKKQGSDNFSTGELLNPGWIVASEDELPVRLPEVKSYQPTGTGQSPLAAITEWVRTTCPKCGGEARRETNTMPQWAGSCWYYLRYLDPHNSERLVDERKEKYWMSPAGVDLYVGGAEHAVLHLLYARFWHKFLFDIGVVSIAEPFHKLFNQGMILGSDGQKMSKSRGNVINPDSLIEAYGADALRLYEMFLGPLEDAKPWNPRGVIGTYRFLGRVWDFVVRGVSASVAPNEKVKDKNEKSQSKIKNVSVDAGEGERIRHRTIKKVTEDIENFRFNTAISALMEYLNALTAYSPRFAGEAGSLQPTAEQKQTLLLLLAPFAPHLAEELWFRLWAAQAAVSHGGLSHRISEDYHSLHTHSWPVYDETMREEDMAVVVVQVNGKVRGEVRCSKNVSEGEVVAKAMELEPVQRALSGQKVQRVVFVPDRLINLVG